MIRIFYGTPGAGKSFGALRDMVEELLYGNRLIVTNLSVNLSAINKWLQDEHPDVDFGDINNRIRIISESDTRQFYAYRSPALDPLAVPTREESLRGRHVDYSSAPAVAYYIDEAHIAFDAREWANTGPELTFYASQHRKLSDECVFITQHPDMLESRLRKLAQEFWSFNNNAIERFMTVFQKPSYFSCEVHRKPPAGPQSPAPMSTYRYRLNKGLADCYDTSAGIGIAGRKLPEKKRKTGLPLALIAVPVLLLGVALYYVPRLMSKGLMAAVHSGTDQLKTDREPDKPSEGGALSRTGGPDGTTLTPPQTPALPVLVQSYAIYRGEAIVTLTDGRILSKATGLTRITKDFIEAGGVRYPVQRGKLRGPAKPAAQ